MAALPDQLQRMTRLSDLLGKLPRLNYDIIHEVFALLKVVVHHQATNLMGPKNLGPALLAICEDFSLTAIIFVPALGMASANLFHLLFQEQDLLFESRLFSLLLCVLIISGAGRPSPRPIPQSKPCTCSLTLMALRVVAACLAPLGTVCCFLRWPMCWLSLMYLLSYLRILSF